MKRLLISAAALTLLGAPAAFADQQQDQWQGRHGGGQSGQGQGQTQGQGQGQGQSHPGMRYDQSSGWIPQTQGQSQGQAQSHPGMRYDQSSGWIPQTQGQSQGRQGGGQQQGGRPDWNAYFKNNPDLQRDYQKNTLNPNYHESQDAYAQRHYLEHGRTEGRNLPTITGGGQGQTQYSPQWGGRTQGQTQYQPQWGGQRGGDQWRDQRGGQERYRGDRGQGDERFRGFGRNTFAQHRYRAPEYRWPRGFGYRRFSFGQYLPQVFFGQDYWLYDYSDYGLPYPPPGTVWVRYGPDALLIDRDTGEIIEVIYSVFY